MSIKRSVRMVIALCVILQAGLCYCPVDPSLPSSRIKYMMSQCGSRVAMGVKSPIKEEVFESDDGTE